jgi:peptidoglycan/LPS O-acetylase OafA/YrhL
MNAEIFFPGGYLAVDFFFILSGFVLSYVYLQRMEGLTFLNFAGQRFSRLWPLHIVTLFLYLGLFFLANTIVGNDLSDPLLWGNSTPIAFVKNIFLVHDLGVNSPLTWNFPSWSVSIEIWVNFALFFAFVALAYTKNSKLVLVVIGGMVFTYFTVDLYNIFGGLNLGHSHDKVKQSVFYARLVRGFFEIFFGVLVYFGSKSLVAQTAGFSKTTILIQSLVEIALIAGLIMVICTPTGNTDVLGVFIFAALLLLLSSAHETLSKTILSKPLFVFLGTISYAIYLGHMPVFEFFRQWPEMFGTVINPSINAALYLFSAIASVFLVAIALHYYVEKPAQKWLRNLFSRRAIARSSP